MAKVLSLIIFIVIVMDIGEQLLSIVDVCTMFYCVGIVCILLQFLKKYKRDDPF